MIRNSEQFNHKIGKAMRTAIFPGSFNPFTIGHRSIVERGLEIFDRIVIAIGYNEHKPLSDSAGKRLPSFLKHSATIPAFRSSHTPGLLQAWPAP